MSRIRFCRASAQLSLLGLLTLFAACGQRGVAPEQPATESEQAAAVEERDSSSGEDVVAESDVSVAREQQVSANDLGVDVEFTNSIGMRLKLIPAGEFMMGSPEGEENRDDDEGPIHCVRITPPVFYMGVYEVTQGEWEKVMGTRPWSGKEYVKEGPDYPATFVSCDDAGEFCRKLSAKERRQYRLPTEAEWEYACRAGTTTAYFFGDDASGLGEYAWYYNNTEHVGQAYAHRVGQKRANAWGIHDMHGNVWECCSDWFGADYYENSPSTDPPGPSGVVLRVGRGGCWYQGARDCRSPSRDGGPPELRNNRLGFRVAAVPADGPGK